MCGVFFCLYFDVLYIPEYNTLFLTINCTSLTQKDEQEHISKKNFHTSDPKYSCIYLSIYPLPSKPRNSETEFLEHSKKEESCAPGLPPIPASTTLPAPSGENLMLLHNMLWKQHPDIKWSAARSGAFWKHYY